MRRELQCFDIVGIAMLILFWFCAAIICFVYFGYPLLLGAGLMGRRRSVRRGEMRPLVSFIVAAHNEEASIEEKLKNILASDYPREQIEILIGSDGSSDRTETIVRKYEADGVGLISFPQQQGKSAIQNRLVTAASGSILVFTDADSSLAPDALRLLLESFADPRVGIVTSHPCYSNASETSIAENESIYFRYDGWLREQESSREMLAMASGPLFAMRRSLWQPLDPNLGDDFVLPLQVAQAGYRNVLDSRVKVAMPLAQNRSDTMLRMKVRIVSKDLRGLLVHSALLNPLLHGSVAIGLWSHKLLRWLVPYFLLGLLASNLALLGHPFFRITLMLQAAFCTVGLVGFTLRDRALAFPLSVPFSFFLVNFAALMGTLKCLRGRTSGQWKPVRKHSPAA
jgi:cellulose synthase/poly-beta-1,6-N-acetylglucosamine synthase-like glycosyltransferase